MSGSERVLVGPLKGYHHETYVFPLPGEAEGPERVRWKCREPRGDLLWFDRRCFRSEEELVRALSGHISRIPDVIDIGDVGDVGDAGGCGGLGLQRFIEGRTLGACHTFSDPIPGRLIAQIVQLFAELADVDPDALSVERRCVPEDRPHDGDSTAFLERLVLFTEEQVYLRNAPRFGELFHALGIERQCFEKLREGLADLTPRPFSLLHGDLHRENFIVDRYGQLWTIDWELAMVGDPLYDLATHLYLMRYRPDQAQEVTRRWCEAVEEVRPGSSEGWERDLPRLLAYKKAQSVFTDVIRSALTLDAKPAFPWWPLHRGGRKIEEVLTRARGPLGLEDVPTHRRIVEALRDWARSDAAHA
ncbi:MULTISPECIES: aminoglycoside phosphotransferase family protein [Streptomyces]|uniref:aminoglycoside phosphotransferase family protein n=1 Tax=Streptomyces TaxID=1883 RepID=UPI001E436AE7|nr:MULTISPECIES: aminoglycoside phosphotransferase family protein [Streptomyces]UFQ16580.1 aminoglycoside phosphotransferase family protein [Streptomyces huasconensis]WCL86181.1 aminoglycoside phosphotransferase family protein [Streptomyces sp. JCM 35825]